MLAIMFVLHFIGIICQEYPHFEPEEFIVGNLRRRDTRPLYEVNRRWYGNNNLNYRRTKDIQEDILDKRIELEESQFREAELDKEKLEKLHRELRWLTIDTDEGIGIGIR